uniref:Ig-like domain-containing protein n=1 Tax=Hippocampus comes TaxID=109280 RepID=A0A3Q2ZKV5_HIPCM
MCPCIPSGMAQPDGCLLQPRRVIWRELGQDAVIQCSVRPNCSSERLHYRWFAFERRSHGRLNLAHNHHKYILHGATLQIMSLNANDSGIYFCAATTWGEPAPGAQHVGLGTTLVVKGKENFFLVFFFKKSPSKNNGPCVFFRKQNKKKKIQLLIILYLLIFSFKELN